MHGKTVALMRTCIIVVYDIVSTHTGVIQDISSYVHKLSHKCFSFRKQWSPTCTMTKLDDIQFVTVLMSACRISGPLTPTAYSEFIRPEYGTFIIEGFHKFEKYGGNTVALFYMGVPIMSYIE